MKPLLTIAFLCMIAACHHVYPIPHPGEVWRFNPDKKGEYDATVDSVVNDQVYYTLAERKCYVKGLPPTWIPHIHIPVADFVGDSHKLLNAIPHPGEIWRDATPYSSDARVDSIVQGKLVMYTCLSDNKKGVCSIDSFTVRGFKTGEVGPIIRYGRLADTAILYSNSVGDIVIDTVTGLGVIKGFSKLKYLRPKIKIDTGSFWKGAEIDTTQIKPDSEQIAVMVDMQWTHDKYEPWMKRMADSMRSKYRRGYSGGGGITQLSADITGAIGFTPYDTFRIPDLW